jgi:hypothetical protein
MSLLQDVIREVPDAMQGIAGGNGGPLGNSSDG